MGLSTVSTFKHINSEKSGLHELTNEESHSLQRTLFEMMIDIDTFCRHNNIEYSLGGGSLLGAVRHGGYIPWDDDIDINFARSDYERFRQLFPQQLGNQYWLHTPEESHNYGICAGKVRKKGTIVRGREDVFNDECGASIDVFIVENVSSNKIIYTLHGLMSMAAGLLLSCRMFYHYRNLYSSLDVDQKTKKVFNCKISIGRFLSIASVDFWTHLWNNINRLNRNDQSQYVTIPVGLKHFFAETYLREKVTVSKDIPFTFDDKTVLFRAMVDPHYYLKIRYGEDYWTPSPEEEREKHLVLEFKLD